MCRTKRRYRKEGDAIAAVVAKKMRGSMHRGRVFHCPVCSGYHITTVPLGQMAA